jgi:hypothetical protein
MMNETDTLDDLCKHLGYFAESEKNEKHYVGLSFLKMIK